MEKVHDSAADRQRAYRERLHRKRQEASAGFTDSELGRAARDLHLSLEAAATQEGNALAELLRGETPAETLRNIQGHITRPPKVKD